MTRSSNPARRFRAIASMAALTAALLLPISAQAQGFLDPRGTLDPRDNFRLDFGWDQQQPFDGGSDAALFEPILAYGELIALNGRTVWRPYAPRGWRPYADGSWDYVPGSGWTWTGLDPWSEITDHSGYWRDNVDIGWVWIPGEGGGRAPWEPARVQWRLGADVIGWAPISEGGNADPRHFVFVPIRGLIAPGEANVFDRARSRAAYNGSETISPREAASLSPQALASHANREQAPRVARLPEEPRFDPRNDPRVDRRVDPRNASRNAPRIDRRDTRGDTRRDTRRDPYDSRRPDGRFGTPPVDSRVNVEPERPQPPLATAPLRTAPPVPTERPGSLAALPDASSATPPLTTEPRETAPRTETVTPSQTPRATPTPTPNPAPTVSAESKPETKPDGPRVVGPQWLSNGDCSARGIREGRCKTD